MQKYCKTCYFGYFGDVWLTTPKLIPSTCRKLLCLSAGKELTSSSMFFWRYCKDVQTYFEYFGHIWLESFDVYLHAENTLHCTLLSWYLSKRILQCDWPKAFLTLTQKPEFCRIWGWCWNINNNISFYFRLFTVKKLLKKPFKKSKNPYFWAILGPFCPNLGKNEFSWKKRICDY